MKYHGSLEELQAAIETNGTQGTWKSDEQKHCFRARTGEILNWYPSTGTLQFQGQRNPDFESLIEASLGKEVVLKKTPARTGAAQIFIVHGHDREARDQLELVLMRLGLQPYILQNSDGGSKTIIEALEQNIYKESAFGIVLMTPDDFGYPKGKDADKQPRARQNVILEMGMVMAALGRDKMAILKKGALEMPSDADGIIRLEFNDRVQEIVPKLVQRLGAAGIQVDPSKIAAASA
ncbi:TIR domain-containing protein [Methylocystis sp. ATCC 49242]|uniref:TIR domain-containing protein n=1 Tax=Methylocystis sp. ATCC 49242 TaxID=622637 RepID=UPI0001F87A07|nr:nucleotide-binding protein [Methylocystis sp. ATCC 49242]